MCRWTGLHYTFNARLTRDACLPVSGRGPQPEVMRGSATAVLGLLASSIRFAAPQAIFHRSS